MKARHAVLAALAAAVTLASVAVAGPDATRQRVAISSKLYPEQTFVLTAFTAGALKRDSGRVRIVSDNGRDVMRAGQEVTIYQATHTLEGKRGTLTIRERTEWVAVSNENAPGYDYPPGVASGTWTVVRGTGQYAGITGSGRSGHAGFGSPWLARQEGFLTSP
jgi:hypothetical protein